MTAPKWADYVAATREVLEVQRRHRDFLVDDGAALNDLTRKSIALDERAIAAMEEILAVAEDAAE